MKNIYIIVHFSNLKTCMSVCFINSRFFFKTIFFRNVIDFTAPALPKSKKQTKIQARTNLFNVFFYCTIKFNSIKTDT